MKNEIGLICVGDQNRGRGGVNGMTHAYLVLGALQILSCYGLSTQPTTFLNQKVSSSHLFASSPMQRREEFESADAYIEHLKDHSTLPQGFSTGTVGLTFRPDELSGEKELPMTISVIALDEPTDAFAAVFTRNLFPGGPIYIGKKRMADSPTLRAIVVNNKISNVCPGGCDDLGMGASEQMCAAVSSALSSSSSSDSILCDSSQVFPSSTGIIGWRLPIQEMVRAMPGAITALQRKSLFPAAQGICTTDRYPKVRAYVSKDGSWTLSACAKGAGMIEPNMATMLAYILTDLDVPGGRPVLQASLSEVCESTFNTISVDGDQSTSDTAVLLSSKKVQVPVSAGKAYSDAVLQEFRDALSLVCRQLSEDMVRNGEGTQVSFLSNSLSLLLSFLFPFPFFFLVVSIRE
jgi:glutamate N-acetyltransferase/amino-acid N-acetyltransferase